MLTLTSLVVFNLHSNRYLFSSVAKKESFAHKSTIKIICLITVSENVECKTYQSHTLIYKTILTHSVKLVFNIFNKSQTKDKIVDNLLINLIKAFSSEM